MTKQSGLSLIETSIVLVIAASVSAGVLAYYNHAKDEKKINDAVKQIQVVASGVSQLSRNALTPIPSADDETEAFNNYVQALATLKGLGVDKTEKGKGLLVLSNGTKVALWRRTSLGANKYELEAYPTSLSQCIKFASVNLGTLAWQPPSLGYFTSNDMLKTDGTIKSAVNVCEEVAKKGIKWDMTSVKVRYHLQF